MTPISLLTRFFVLLRNPLLQFFFGKLATTQPEPTPLMNPQRSANILLGNENEHP
jgi:hypothetical protein